MPPRRYRSTYQPRSLRRIKKQSQKQLYVAIGLGLVILYFFLSWGLPALIGGLSVFNKLKPASQKVVSVEDSAIAPPVLNIPYEATNSAIIKINGYASPSSKVEIYLDGDVKSVAQTGEDGKFITDDITLSVGTNNISGKTIIAPTGQDPKKSLSSKNIRLIYSDEKPNLEISEPNNNTEIKGGDKKVRVSGKADPEDSVTVNNILVILDQQGKFTTTVSLEGGDNNISVISTNQVGNITKIDRKVIYTP